MRNLREKLTLSWRGESRAFYRVSRRGATNTSSAGYAEISPRSNAATRCSISSARFFSISGSSDERSDSNNSSASFARSSTDNARACSSIYFREGGMADLIFNASL